jgi:hypothetical protein
VCPVQLYRPKTHFNAGLWLYVIQTVPCTGHFRGASGLPCTSKDINLQANSGTNYRFVFPNKSGCEGGWRRLILKKVLTKKFINKDPLPR